MNIEQKNLFDADVEALGFLEAVKIHHSILEKEDMLNWDLQEAISLFQKLGPSRYDKLKEQIFLFYLDAMQEDRSIEEMAKDYSLMRYFFPNISGKGSGEVMFFSLLENKLDKDRARWLEASKAFPKHSWVSDMITKSLSKIAA